MRFLTAYFAVKEDCEIVLTGSQRMQERPIGILVEALKELGADIEYLKNEGFPPLKIKGKKLQKNKVSIVANTSSQYLSALILVASSLPNGLILTLEGDITSRPYLSMTLALLQQLGIESTFIDNKITILPQKAINDITIVVESDWSSASYFYSFVALSEGMEIYLKSFRHPSLQGDAALSSLYNSLGVTTQFFPMENTIKLSKATSKLPPKVNLDLVNTPDIAQTIAVTCFGLGIECHLTGLHTLKIKETDRLLALKTELEKLGATITITHDSLSLQASENITKNSTIATYNDHRMAMAFAPLALKTNLQIEDADVVSKSYPTFWQDLKKLGFSIQFQ